MKHQIIVIPKEPGTQEDFITVDQFRETVMEDFEQFRRDYFKLNSENKRDIENWVELYCNWLESN